MTTTSLRRENFAAFFLEVRGFSPFAWQERLLDAVLDSGSWPSSISAPTGTGKTSVIDVHVFANALAAVGNGPRVPRRLAMVVDRRVLVDSHEDHARILRDTLASGGEGTVVARVREALATLPRGPLDQFDPPVPLLVAGLRGGQPASRAWRVEPEVCAVIACTPDMFGSRLLLRPYGSSWRAAAQEGGLLAYDCVAVVDEAHLARQLTLTARRVAELAARAETPVGPPILQVVDTTATPDGTGVASGIGVLPADLDSDEVLAARLQRPKPVDFLELPVWPAAGSDASKRVMAAAVADRVDQIIGELPDAGGRPQTVGCILNRVDDAAAVARELRRRRPDDEGAAVLLTGRMRPWDRAVLDEEFPGLLSIEGNTKVRVLVATQTIEVGVDVDLAGLVTDLASGSAIAQRAGRVNRIGRRPGGEIHVIVPREDLSDKASMFPYTHEDLRGSLSWLRERKADPQGLAPVVLMSEDARPPQQRPRRDLYQRLSAEDARFLARTNRENFAEPDLDLWLSDDLSVDTTRGLVLRTLVNPDSSDDDGDLGALQVTRLCPPLRHETIPVARTVLTTVLTEYREKFPTAPVLRFRPDTPERTEAVEEIKGEGDLVTSFRTGDVAILDAARCGPEVLPWLLRVRPTVNGPDDVGDVYEQFPLATGEGDDPLVLRVGAFSGIPWSKEEGELFLGRLENWRSATPEDAAPGETPEPGEETARDDVLELLDRLTPTSAHLARRFRAVRNALAGDARRFAVHDSGKDAAPWVVFVDAAPRRVGEEQLQLGTPTRDTVYLDDHQNAVAERVRESARSLGVEEELVDVLSLAAVHHDDGKKHPAFQHDMLGASSGRPWAKGRRMTAAQARRRAGLSSLPRGWRHEQLSVLLAAGLPQLETHPRRDLVLRLIGTTHGRGRPGFSHRGTALLSERFPERAAAAAELFDSGRWEELGEAVDRQFGVWGSAYLEALLRAADSRVSREGS